MSNSLAPNPPSPTPTAGTAEPVRVAVVVATAGDRERVARSLLEAGLGADAAEVSVAAPEDRHRPFLLVAKSLDELDEELLSGAAASDFLLEPCTGSELAFRVRMLAGRCRSRPEQVVGESNDLAVIVRSIADAVNVGVLFFDNQKRPTLRNRMVEEMLRLTGFDPATGLSKYVFASDRRTRVKQDKNILTQTLEGDERGLLYWIGDPGGEQRAIITEAHRIARSDGAPLGSAIVTYDVTDLANAIDIREEYLASVSHELRTPLTSIVGYLDLIEDEYDLEALGIEAEFAVMQRNAAQLLALIHDLLSTSTGEFALRIEPVDLATLLDQSVNAFRPAMEKAGHSFERGASVSALHAEVDPARVKQVIDNVISNAVKYTPAGGTITVTLEEDAGDAVIRVADTGRGMSTSDQHQLFDRFFRSREVREEAIQGVGLGLTIVKMIVDAHYGSIDVASEIELGTTMTIRLPLRAKADVALTSPGEGDTE